MLDLKDLKTAIKQIAAEKGFPEDKIWEVIETAIAKAYKKEHLGKNAKVRARIDRDDGSVSFERIYLVVDDSIAVFPKKNESESEEKDEKEDKASAENTQENSETTETTKKIRFSAERHLKIEDALKINPNAKPGEEILVPLEKQASFTRIAAQSAKQTIIQQLHELEKSTIIEEYQNKNHEIVSGIIQKIDRGSVIVHLGKALGILSGREAIPFERLKVDERKKFLALGIKEIKGSLMVILSRTHPDFIAKLLALEVPEIQEGIVEIKAVAREPGSRSKIAVLSKQPEIDAVGACIGPKGVRVNALMEEIPNEKIDIVEYSEEPVAFVINALSPVRIKETEIDPGKKEIKVFVEPDLLPAVIGKNGQNIRLASKLTGWNIKAYSILAPDIETKIGPDENNYENNEPDETQNDDQENQIENGDSHQEPEDEDWEPDDSEPENEGDVSEETLD